MARSQFLLG